MPGWRRGRQRLCAPAGCPSPRCHRDRASAPKPVDIGAEGDGVHRPVERHRSGQGGAAQGCGEGRGQPMAVRDRGTAAAAAPGAAVKAGHLGRGTSLVDEYQLVGIETWRKFTPSLTSGGDVGPVLLGCVRVFFEGGWRDGRESAKPSSAQTKLPSRLRAFLRSRPGSCLAWL